MPDLNSLPPSRTVPSAAHTSTGSEEAALRGQSPSSLSRSTSTSLQAAAAVNAGLRHEGSRRSSGSSASRNRPHAGTGRRRSTVLMNLQLNDPNVPGPGEMVSENAGFRSGSPNSITSSPTIPSHDARHYRTPSLGEIHQELEQEQEAQVNRLLQMIRVQQQQLQQLQAAGSTDTGSPSATDEYTSEQSTSLSSPNVPHVQPTQVPRSPTVLHPRASIEMARAEIHRQSRTPSRTASPLLRSASISAEAGLSWNLGGRDESAFYQAETQMMVRENQMLRQRIRELERQVTELHANSALTHGPASPSNLARSTSVSEEPFASALRNVRSTSGEAAKED
ncbi:hypothetical protein BJ878DRAFT_1832 [Calycina marina]|uniref:Uncharacterized protein n=1 Tax=Calycina marina TaxID=1763456 RepID=A0A9P8CL65_9HELO|nr:hypothetical protein BJ878DRAFT_1832 [Calycina marina]